MKKYYLRNDFPIKTNCPESKDVEISEQEYKRICKERKDQEEVDRIAQEEALKPIREREKKIQERMRKIAEDQLIEEEEIDG